MATKPKSLRAKANALAWELLSELRESPAAKVVGRAQDPDVAIVRVIVTPPGDAGAEPRRVGKWVSPTCFLILTKLGAETMTRTELARRCQMSYDPRFKTLIADLIERELIEEPEDGGGIRTRKKSA